MPSTATPIPTAAGVDDKTLVWLDGVLTRAKEEGKAVLTFSHQNLVRHNARFPFGYTFGNAMEIRELLAGHGVSLNLSGHIHFQHIGSFDGIHEVTTSALSIAENHIGVVEIDPERKVTYQVRQLDVAGYAQAAGLTNPDLLHFGEYSRQYFRENSMRSMGDKLEMMGISEADRESMLEAAGNSISATSPGAPSATGRNWQLCRGMRSGKSSPTVWGTTSPLSDSRKRTRPRGNSGRSG